MITCWPTSCDFDADNPANDGCHVVYVACSSRAWLFDEWDTTTILLHCFTPNKEGRYMVLSIYIFIDGESLGGFSI